MNEPRFLQLTDVSEILNISDIQTYALVRSGDLKVIQIAGRHQRRVERVRLDDLIEEGLSADGCEPG